VQLARIGGLVDGVGRPAAAAHGSQAVAVPSRPGPQVPSHCALARSGCSKIEIDTSNRASLGGSPAGRRRRPAALTTAATVEREDQLTIVSVRGKQQFDSARFCDLAAGGDDVPRAFRRVARVRLHAPFGRHC
jgi:hypothetical protein